MRVGGSASIVTVFTALYPLPVVLLAPLVLHEYITPVQSLGVACAIIAIVLLSLPSRGQGGSAPTPDSAAASASSRP
jgi:drug/metabolite transporter (DMT)-like permease